MTTPDTTATTATTASTLPPAPLVARVQVVNHTNDVVELTIRSLHIRLWPGHDQYYDLPSPDGTDFVEVTLAVDPSCGTRGEQDWFSTYGRYILDVRSSPDVVCGNWRLPVFTVTKGIAIIG